MINNQLTLIIAVFDISVSHKCSGILSVLLFCRKVCADLGGYIPDIKIINEAVDRKGKIIRGGCRKRIITLVYGDKPNAEFGENLFFVFSHINIISAETGLILYDYAIDLSRLNVLHHSLKFSTVKVGTAFSVILVLVIQFELRMQFHKVIYQLSLVADTVAFAFGSRRARKVVILLR